jgi:hypothetical protein
MCPSITSAIKLSIAPRAEASGGANRRIPLPRRPSDCLPLTLYLAIESYRPREIP